MCVLMHRDTRVVDFSQKNNIFCASVSMTIQNPVFKTHSVLSVEIGVDADEILDDGNMASLTCMHDWGPVITLWKRRKKRSVPLVSV